MEITTPNANIVAKATGRVRHSRKVGKVKPSTWPGMKPRGFAIRINKNPYQKKKKNTNHKTTGYNLF